MSNEQQLNNNEINKIKLIENIIKKHIKISKTKVLSTCNKVTTPISYEKINVIESLKTFDVELIITDLIKTEKIEIKQYTTRKLHAVLVFKITTDMASNKFLSGCINRDKNNVLNMTNIVYHLIMTGTRPEIFRREQTTNQCNDSVNCVEASEPCRGKKQIKRKSIKIKEIEPKEIDTNKPKLHKPKLTKSKSKNSIKKNTNVKNCNKIKGTKVPIQTN